MPTLKELLVESKDGEWGAGSAEEKTTEMKVVRGTDFENFRTGQLRSIPIRHIQNRHAQRKTLQVGDIIIETAGGSRDRPTGRTVIVNASRLAQCEQPLVPASFARFLRIDQNLVCPGFLFWKLQAMYEDGTLKKYHTQHTGVARFQFTTFSTQEVMEFPDRPEQERIASILSSYDDLIENNTRRIVVLEEMARRIYEEWFVHFRAPGSETLPRINTPLGPVPEGWEVVRLDQIAEVNPEQISPKYPPDQIAYIDIASVSPGKIDQVVAMPFAEAPGRARRIVRDGDTIWSSVRPNRRSYALVINPEPNWIASTGFAVLRPRGAFSTFLYFATTAESFVSYLVGRATGSAYPAVKASDFEEAALVRPPNELLERFSDCVDPMVRLGANLNRQNRNLRTQRDLLLPKLISGEIDVAEAPAYLEAAE